MDIFNILLGDTYISDAYIYAIGDPQRMRMWISILRWFLLNMFSWPGYGFWRHRGTLQVLQVGGHGETRDPVVARRENARLYAQQHSAADALVLMEAEEHGCGADAGKLAGTPSRHGGWPSSETHSGVHCPRERDSVLGYHRGWSQMQACPQRGEFLFSPLRHGRLSETHLSALRRCQSSSWKCNVCLGKVAGGARDWTVASWISGASPAGRAQQWSLGCSMRCSRFETSLRTTSWQLLIWSNCACCHGPSDCQAAEACRGWLLAAAWSPLWPQYGKPLRWPLPRLLWPNVQGRCVGRPAAAAHILRRPIWVITDSAAVEESGYISKNCPPPIIAESTWRPQITVTARMDKHFDSTEELQS